MRIRWSSAACMAVICLTGVLTSVLTSGCGGSKSNDPATVNSHGSTPSAEGAKYLLATEPAGAKGVVAMLADAKDGDTVVVVGRIGGQADPWIENRAAFFVVDTSLKPCNEIEGDTCEKPWDYCCEADIGKSRTLVKIVDDQEMLVETDARKLINVKELQTVVVTGKAKRDEDGSVTVLASGLYVKSK